MKQERKDSWTLVRCDLCDGHGIRPTWSFGVKEPDECPDCGGKGQIVRYKNGGLASYPGGPFVARTALSEAEGGK